MEETYEKIVQKWYMRLRGSFTDILMDKYKNSNMRLADVENIYQDVFIAIHQNIEEGRIGTNWDWRNYIIRVGLNMASKKYRMIGRHDSLNETDPEDGEKLSARAQKINDILKALPTQEGDPGLYNDPDAQALLGDELNHTPEPCASIIRKTYFSGMSDAEIAEEVAPYRDNGKSLAVNAKAVRARRWLCMRDLIYRVKLALYNAGIIDEKPERMIRNGR
ncbi:MAG: hypothetical protein HDS80_03245 [Bacteroidales bacterium]|nr:hypothetical protein [Bacteroidales bacterium]